MFGIGYSSSTVILLSLQKSPHMCGSPFFLIFITAADDYSDFNSRMAPISIIATVLALAFSAILGIGGVVLFSLVY